MPEHDLKNWSVDGLLNELEAASLQEKQKRDGGADWSCRRRHTRYPCRRDCKVYYVARGGGTVVSLEGRMRNISQSGMGILVQRGFTPRDAVEVEVLPPINGKAYFGGLVRFCRYAGNGYYELGMEFRSASSRSFFANDPLIARRLTTEWQERDAGRDSKA